MSPEEQDSLALINPELLEILKSQPPLKFINAGIDIPSTRKKFQYARESLLRATTQPSKEPVFVERDIRIPVQDGSSIAVRVHSPKTPADDGCPGLIFYHGGGFVFGGLVDETPLCRMWTSLGGVAVNVDYRLAPEFPFPTPISDAFDAAKWTASHLDELNINPVKGFICGGVSAGANLAAVVSHMYRDAEISPALTGTYLSCPPILSGKESAPEKYQEMYRSRFTNTSDPLLYEEALQLFDKSHQAVKTSPLRCPIYFKSHHGLPPTYFQVCGMDPLRDDGLIYEGILREDAGVQTRLDIFPGLGHCFWVAYPQATFTKDYTDLAQMGLIWLLEQTEHSQTLCSESSPKQ